MTSERKSKANRRNAKRSTGPRDTTRSRLNAQKHGIFSSELLIEPEDADIFEEFSDALWQWLAPVGPLEELQLDLLITHAWKLRIVNRYEATSIKIKAQLVTEAKEQEEKIPDEQTRDMIVDIRLPYKEGGVYVGDLITLSLYRSASWEDLITSVERLERYLKALDQKDPLDGQLELWYIVFATASKTIRCAHQKSPGVDEAMGNGPGLFD